MVDKLSFPFRMQTAYQLRFEILSPLVGLDLVIQADIKPSDIEGLTDSLAAINTANLKKFCDCMDLSEKCLDQMWTKLSANLPHTIDHADLDIFAQMLENIIIRFEDSHCNQPN